MLRRGWAGLGLSMLFAVLLDLDLAYNDFFVMLMSMMLCLFFFFLKVLHGWLYIQGVFRASCDYHYSFKIRY